MNWGGPRPGAGRKPREGEVKAVTVRIKKEIYDKLPTRGKEELINEALRLYFEK